MSRLSAAALAASVVSIGTMIVASTPVGSTTAASVALTQPSVLRALVYDQSVKNGPGGGVVLENAVGVTAVRRDDQSNVRGVAYLVTFDRNVSKCAFNVTAAIAGYTFVPPTPYPIPIEGQPPELVGLNTGVPANPLAPPPDPRQVWVWNAARTHDVFYIVANC
jgi:hypothetical protein